METRLVTLDGESLEATPENVGALVREFWLVVVGLDDDTAEHLLSDTFGFHPLAVEDAEHFGQRPKVDGYDDCTFVVVYGAILERPTDRQLGQLFDMKRCLIAMRPPTTESGSCSAPTR